MELPFLRKEVVEQYMDDNKKICKNIENCFDRLQKENNNLLNELIIYKSFNKSYVDEIQKVLEQIAAKNNFIQKLLEISKKSV